VATIDDLLAELQAHRAALAALGQALTQAAPSLWPGCSTDGRAVQVDLTGASVTPVQLSGRLPAECWCAVHAVGGSAPVRVVLGDDGAAAACLSVPQDALPVFFYTGASQNRLRAWARKNAAADDDCTVILTVWSTDGRADESV
jgi:hypothetical protein